MKAKIIIASFVFLLFTNFATALTINVSGAGSDGLNGMYSETGMLNGKKYFTKETENSSIRWTGSEWKIMNERFVRAYWHAGNTTLPPQTGWEIDEGDSPAPVLSGDGTPVELASMTAHCENGSVELVWSTESAVQTVGFIIERNLLADTSWNRIASYRTHSDLACLNSPIGPAEYSYTDSDVQPEQSYVYRLSDVDFQGNTRVLNIITITITEVRNQTGSDFPQQPKLLLPYPNPFNPTTTIKFALPENEHVRIRVFDVTGRQVAGLMNSQMNAGFHRVQWNAGNASSGVYFIQMATEKFQAREKCLLIK